LRIIGIDPGSVLCGFGVIEKNKGKITVIEQGVIKAGKFNKNLYIRLKEIYSRLYQVVQRTQPDTAAFESLFYSKNAQSLMKLSHARASAILAAVNNDIPLKEYSPREIKKAVTGNGNASKEQVSYMVKSLLEIKETPEFFDVTDALAVAICHAFRADSPDTNAKSWADFIEQNPDRVSKNV
jgi:crossover junction endodeoxyribonuclease RuvC